MSIVISRLGPDDAAAYKRIRLSMLDQAADAFGADYSEEAARPLSFFADRLSGGVAFGAWAGSALVGVMDYQRGARPKERHKALLRGVFVEPEWRRHGVAAKLLAAAIDCARGELEQLTLTVVGGNEPALALYRRFGFKVYGVEPRARKLAHGYLDQILMVLLFTERDRSADPP